jgi:sugar phosphate permease
VHGDDQGLASGLLNTSQQVGGALGLAVLSTVAFNHSGSPVSGYTTAFTVGGILMATGAVLILLLIRGRDVANIATGEPALAAA